MRISRRTGIVSTSSSRLLRLFENATILKTGGYGATSTGTASVVIDGGTSSPVWVISSTGRGIAIAKVKNNTVTPIKAVAMSDTPSSTEITAATYFSSDTRIVSGSAYGVVMVALRFTGYTEAEVDSILDGAVVEILAGRNSRSAGNVSVAASSISQRKKDLYIQALSRAAGQGFSLTSGSSPGTAVIESLVNLSASPPWWYLNTTGNEYYLGSSSGSAGVLGGMICHI